MSDYEHSLTPEELRWVRSLRALAARRPKTLGLWGGAGDVLSVVALNEDGGFMHGEGDREVVCVVTSIRIPTGGGDPDWIDVADVSRPWAGT